jgi:hypothetical protein
VLVLSNIASFIAGLKACANLALQQLETQIDMTKQFIGLITLIFFYN